MQCTGKFLEDGVNLHNGVIPWLPEFVPKVGLKIVKNGILSFSGANILEHLASSFIEALCHLRQQSNYYENLIREFYIALKEIKVHQVFIQSLRVTNFLLTPQYTDLASTTNQINIHVYK